MNDVLDHPHTEQASSSDSDLLLAPCEDGEVSLVRWSRHIAHARVMFASHIDIV